MYTIYLFTIYKRNTLMFTQNTCNFFDEKKKYGVGFRLMIDNSLN